MRRVSTALGRLEAPLRFRETDARGSEGSLVRSWSKNFGVERSTAGRDAGRGGVCAGDVAIDAGDVIVREDLVAETGN